MIACVSSMDISQYEKLGFHITVKCLRLPAIAYDCIRLPAIAYNCLRLHTIAYDCIRLPAIAFCHLPSSMLPASQAIKVLMETLSYGTAGSCFMCC